MYYKQNSSGKYCSNKCQQNKRKQLRLEQWLQGGELPGRGTLREYIKYRDGNKCSVCGITEWNGQKLQFDIDHADGNPYNNDSKNLRFLCPNCHSQTPTYKAKNKGNGRTERRKRAITDYHKNKPL